MPRGRGRGGEHQTRGRGRGGGPGRQTSDTRDRRYNVREAAQADVSTSVEESPRLPEQNSTQKSVTRNRRPAASVAAVPVQNGESKPASKNPTKASPPPVREDDDPDYLYRSKIPVKDPKYGHGVRYNPKDPNAKIPITKIYVSKFGNASSEKLKECFSQYGPIKEIVVKLGDLFAYAFITFDHHKDAIKALASEAVLGTRKLMVKQADEKHQPMPTHIDKLAAITAPDACYIQKLNDDCLRHIFSYLDLVTRTQAEVVCKCWHRLIRVMWLVVRSLDFCSPPLSTFLKEGSSSYDFTAKQLTSYTGHNLASLTVKRFHSLDTMKTVRDNCTALERLHLVHFTLYDSKVVIPSLKTIKHLSMEGCSFADKLMTKLFSVAKSLESVSVTRQTSGTGFIECLSGMRSLSLRSCEVTHAVFSKFLARSAATLQRLSLSKCRLDEEMYESAVELLVQHVPHLEALTLDLFYRATETLRLDALYKLSNLRSLSLCLNNAMTSEILLRIGRNNRALEELVLDCASGITPESIANLGKLPRLSSLSLCHIRDIHGLKNEALIGLVNNLASPTQLRHLFVANTSLSDEALYAVLTICVALETLNVSMCRHVTEATLMTAEDAVASRTCPPFYLTLNIDNTPIQTAVAEAASSGKRFNPRLLFRESAVTVLKQRGSLIDLALESDDADSDFSGEDGGDLMDALNLVDSDEEYIYLMGLGVDPLDLDDFLGYQIAGMNLDSDVDYEDDDDEELDPEYYPAF